MPRLLSSQSFSLGDRGVARLLSILLVLFALWIALVPSEKIGMFSQGGFVLDGPGRALQWIVALTIAVAAALMATTRPRVSTVISLALAAAAGCLWAAAAATLDLALVAVLWGAGWVLAAAAVGRQRTAIGLEAGIKLHAIGASASLILILGAALIAGLTRTTHMLEAGYLLGQLPDSSTLALATVRVLVVACALGAGWVPFHLWAPDGLSAAPRSVAAVLAVAAPLSSAFCLARIAYAFEPSLISFQVHWQGGLFAIAVLTVVFAGSVALVQRDAARLLAYLTIVQAAEFIPAVVASPQDAGPLVWAAAAHALALVPAWLALAAWSEAEGAPTGFGRLSGEGRRAPIRAILLSLAFVLAVGVPGGVRFFSRPDAALLASPHAGWGVLLVVSTIVQWAAVVRLLRTLFLESPAAQDEPFAWSRGNPAWVLVLFLVLAHVYLALFAWPMDLSFGAWGEMLPGG